MVELATHLIECFAFSVTTTFTCTLKFVVKDCDPNTGEADEEGYEDEYVVSIWSCDALMWFYHVGVHILRRLGFYFYPAWRSWGHRLRPCAEGDEAQFCCFLGGSGSIQWIGGYLRPLQHEVHWWSVPGTLPGENHISFWYRNCCRLLN